MFKSAFTKYLTAFGVIILTSFLLLSGIVTAVVRSYTEEDEQEGLALTATVIAEQLEGGNVTSIEAFAYSPISSTILESLLNRFTHVDILLLDADCRVWLSTLNTAQSGERRQPYVPSESLILDRSFFTRAIDEDGDEYLTAHGTLDGILEEHSVLYAAPVVTQQTLRGYVAAVASSTRESEVVSATRRALINASLWVMLAAMIAVYFITERMVHPLRVMTDAVKSYAKGDFSSRVPISGRDEVGELASAFNAMAESLANLETMRNSFMASVSHELRTPMTTIAGFIDGITSGAIPEEKREYYLNVISSEIHRLSRLVTEMLDIARLASGDRKFNLTTFDVAEVARIILISFEQRIEEKELNVIFESDEDAMPVVADKDAIHQVIYNLCHNAIKFSKQGGKLAISITHYEDRKVRVSVYDDGQSISREELPLVFDRFYKTDKSRSLDKSGVGLGLYICKTIIDAHGEHIQAESGHINGCEFWFTLKEGELPQKRKSQME